MPRGSEEEMSLCGKKEQSDQRWAGGGHRGPFYFRGVEGSFQRRGGFVLEAWKAHFRGVEGSF
jgi:hypothetical protein